MKNDFKKEYFKKMLISMQFIESGNQLYKFINDIKLIVDFDKELISYPEKITINDKTTCNFSHPENFVVFECVHRLLEKGYQPQHLELEPKWKLGHEAKSGKADILVRSNSGDALLIIECKTWGKEFDKAWKDTLTDGGQLFSYITQEPTSQFACLYASTYENNEIKTDYRLIIFKDNTELLKNLKEPKTYQDKGNVQNLFATWKETYAQDYATRGLFESDMQAYDIGKQKYSIDDLQSVDNESIQKKYHEFATILRQHNVSGRENAFDKLVNLFLAKIVDETSNAKDLMFYWKGIAYDDFFSLQDRLQALYKKGMDKFLNEDVTYIDNKDIEKAFRLFKNDPDATKETILNYFRQLKFFTNNDFAFIAVHNEKLFYQNAEILKKIVLMLQDMKLKTQEQNQFLGDLFEGFLDAGVKQSEGQFFTPMPIVKFLIASLPLEQIISQTNEIPACIDYSCGAGHFLTEYAEQIRPFIPNEQHKNYFAQIYGIEKEYRLSKVAKVSTFMYGQEEVNIVYADALGQNKEIKNNHFSVLVANPPYSVKGFLETLSDEEVSKFSLSEYASDKSKNNSIECFFVERSAQLLKEDGVAAIVLPSSILSNGNIYSKMREILLQNFDILAISEFGSGTFGKTGTNTATLFLRRKKQNPSLKDHFQNRVNEWFKGDNKADTVFEDKHLLENYCEHIGIDLVKYQTLLTGMPSKELWDMEIFKEYQKLFSDNTKAKQIKKKRISKTYTQAHKDVELQKYILSETINTEKDKLYYFCLASSQKEPVLIVKSPSGNKEIKEFLGYEWSGSKGNEGIKYIGSNISSDEDETIARLKGIASLQSPLINPNDLNDESKINFYIRQNFLGEISSNTQIPQHLSEFVSLASLPDMLDFTRTDFDKQLRTSSLKKIEIKSKYPLVKLGDVCDIYQPKTITSKEIKDAGNYKVYGANGVIGFYSKYNHENSEVAITCRGATCGTVNFTEPYSWITGNAMVLSPLNNQLQKEFLKNLLTFIDLTTIITGTAQPQITRTNIAPFKIPLPPLDIQQKIVDECNKVDDEYNNSKIEIANYRNLISQTLNNVQINALTKGGGNKPLKIKDLCEINISKSAIKNIDDKTLVSFIEMASVSDEGFIANKIDRPIGELRSGSYTYFAENDIIIAKITPCMENGKCAIAKNLTNGIGMGSSEFHRFRCNNNILPKFLFDFLNRENIRKEAEKQMTGSSGHRRVPVAFYENLSIPVPPLEEQQKIVAEINGYEAEIEKYKVIIKNTNSKKQTILDKYLF